MALRLELYEKYPIGGEVDMDYYQNLRIEPPEVKHGYRRTMPLIETIERPIEIPGNKKELIIRFWGGEDMTILGDYDSFCIQLNDIEENMLIEQQMVIQSIENSSPD